MRKHLSESLIFISLLAVFCTSPVCAQLWHFHDGKLQRAASPPLYLSPDPEVRAADIDLDTHLEVILLDGGKVSLCEDSACDKPEWQSPSNWRVKQAAFTELNRDGHPELALLVWRPFEPWPIDRYLVKGGRINTFQDKEGNSCHLILIGWRENSYRELWAGSAMAGKVRFRCGKGSSSAAPKITTMTAITTRFATEISKIDQCR